MVQCATSWITHVSFTALDTLICLVGVGGSVCVLLLQPSGSLSRTLCALCTLELSNAGLCWGLGQRLGVVLAQELLWDAAGPCVYRLALYVWWWM